jgi:hypothetical protein
MFEARYVIEVLLLHCMPFALIGFDDKIVFMVFETREAEPLRTYGTIKKMFSIFTGTYKPNILPLCFK